MTNKLSKFDTLILSAATTLEMSQLLYQQSVSYLGYLIIPFVFKKFDTELIYSYTLLSELGYKGKFHKLANPARLYSSNIDTLVALAKEHLQEKSDIRNSFDYFKCRYTYKHNLIIIYGESGKYFYDHYKPDSLNNVAAPKLFNSKHDCLRWIKQGLDSSDVGGKSKQI